MWVGRCGLFLRWVGDCGGMRSRKIWEIVFILYMFTPTTTSKIMLHIATTHYSPSLAHLAPTFSDNTLHFPLLNASGKPINTPRTASTSYSIRSSTIACST